MGCLRAFGLLLAANMAACGDNDDGSGDAVELSEVDSETALLATQGATYGAIFEAIQAGVTLPFAYECLEGGTAEVSGELSIEDAPLDIQVDVDVYLDACARDNVIMDGVLAISQGVVVGGLGATEVHTVVDGTVTYGGAINGSCDMYLEVYVDTVGDVVSVQGHACGQDAELDLVLMPAWL